MHDTVHNMDMELWRATDEERFTGQWSCWAAERESAEAYTDNPGFGGSVVLRAEVQGNRALDMTGSAAEAFDILAETLRELLPDEEWSGQQLYMDFGQPWTAWESVPQIAQALSGRYYWLVYEDDFPVRCATWCYLRDEPLAAEEVA